MLLNYLVTYMLQRILTLHLLYRVENPRGHLRALRLNLLPACHFSSGSPVIPEAQRKRPKIIPSAPLPSATFPCSIRRILSWIYNGATSTDGSPGSQSELSTTATPTSADERSERSSAARRRRKSLDLANFSSAARGGDEPTKPFGQLRQPSAVLLRSRIGQGMIHRKTPLCMISIGHA